MKNTKNLLLLLILSIVFITTNCAQDKMKYNELTEEEKNVILDKGTERAFTGEYHDHKGIGTYICKQCDAALYKSDDKFDSQCGWPSFDDEIDGAVKRIPDADGLRTEIVCTNCRGHLGHVFIGEGFTPKDTRHCVNSISLKFVPEKSEVMTETVYLAGGCFWGTEYFFNNEEGVVSTSVGYIGGHKDNPSYEEVCSGTTGHAEVVEVEYDPEKVSYKKLARLFFEIHDFTQVNRQGPDVGEQYRTEIFYTTENQREISRELIDVLTAKNYKVATKLTKANKYWIAEDYHQDYYEHKGQEPYCHMRKKIFD
jgi:peptide methionine sulfoxide reductase msrA/msrB